MLSVMGYWWEFQKIRLGFFWVVTKKRVTQFSWQLLIGCFSHCSDIRYAHDIMFFVLVAFSQDSLHIVTMLTSCFMKLASDIRKKILKTERFIVFASTRTEEIASCTEWHSCLLSGYRIRRFVKYVSGQLAQDFLTASFRLQQRCRTK